MAPDLLSDNAPRYAYWDAFVVRRTFLSLQAYQNAHMSRDMLRGQCLLY
jgi:hypothetical protein